MDACDRSLLIALLAPGAAALSAQTPTFVATPLTEMGQSETYLGFAGGLYPGGSNVPPPAHAAAGTRARPGHPAARHGRQPERRREDRLLSIGMSHATQEFCSANGLQPCNPWTFIGQALVDSAVSHTTLALVNGARSGQTAIKWSVPDRRQLRPRPRRRPGGAGTDRGAGPGGLAQGGGRPSHELAAQRRRRRVHARDAARRRHPLREDALPEPAVRVRHEPQLRGLRDLRPESRTVRVRVGIRGQVDRAGPDRPDGQRRRDRRSARRGPRLRHGRAVDRLGTVPLGRRHDPARKRRARLAARGLPAGRPHAPLDARRDQGREHAARLLQERPAHAAVVPGAVRRRDRAAVGRRPAARTSRSRARASRTARS